MSVRGVPFLSQMRVSHQAYSRPGQSYFCCPCWSRPKADGEWVVDELSRAPCLRTGRTALGVHASRLSDLPRVEVRFTTFPSRRLPGQPSRLAEVGLKLLAFMGCATIGYKPIGMLRHCKNTAPDSSCLCPFWLLLGCRAKRPEPLNDAFDPRCQNVHILGIFGQRSVALIGCDQKAGGLARIQVAADRTPLLPSPQR